MRSFLFVSAVVLGLSACASQSAPPAKPAAAAAPAAAAPQCWNGDAGRFEDIGAKATISGVAVTCEKTSDGKSGQWMSKKH